MTTGDYDDIPDDLFTPAQPAPARAMPDVPMRSVGGVAAVVMVGEPPASTIALAGIAVEVRSLTAPSLPDVEALTITDDAALGVALETRKALLLLKKTITDEYDPPMRKLRGVIDDIREKRDAHLRGVEQRLSFLTRLIEGYEIARRQAEAAKITQALAQHDALDPMVAAAVSAIEGGTAPVAQAALAQSDTRKAATKASGGYYVDVNEYTLPDRARLILALAASVVFKFAADGTKSVGEVIADLLPTGQPCPAAAKLLTLDETALRELVEAMGTDLNTMMPGILVTTRPDLRQRTKGKK